MLIFACGPWLDSSPTALPALVANDYSSIPLAISPGNNAAAFTYTAFGALATVTDGCTGTGCVNAVEAYSYNNRLQPVIIQLSSPGINNRKVYNYYANPGTPTSCATPSQGTGNNGNVMGYYYSDPKLGHSATFGYDSLNRLHTAVATGTSPANYNWTYTYDQFGNMQCSGFTGGVDTCPAMSYNAGMNRLSAIGSQTPQYDAAGNLTSDGTGTGTHSYTWDAEGHLTSIASPSGGSVIATYQYNALGQRVQASGSALGANPVFQYYDAFGHLALHGDLLTWAYAPLPPVNGKVYGKYANNTLFLHADALGSSGTTTLQDGSWANSEIYDPWGQRWGTVGTPWDERFASIDNVRDPESGLDQTPNRMLNSTYGRWLSPDPAGEHAVRLDDPQTWNMYAYARNNPTTLTDPSGLYFCKDSKDCSSAADQSFKARLASLAAARDKFKPGSAQYKRIQQSVDAYGKENEKNSGGQNVVIDFSDKQKAAGATQRIDKDTISVTFKGDFAKASEHDPVGYTAGVGHEGVHVAEGAPQGTDRFASEVHAFMVNQDVYEGLNSGPRFSGLGVTWNPDTMRTDSLPGFLNRMGAAIKVGWEDYKEDLNHDNDPE